MNSRIFLFLPLCLFLAAYARAQEVFYPVWQIDPALKQNASKVIRRNDVEIRLNAMNAETVTIHKVITILKGNSVEDASCRVYYDKWSDVDRFEGAIYDASGRLIRKLGRKDITERSAIENGTLYSDQRIQIIQPAVAEIPFTVEYHVKQTFRKMLPYPSWTPQEDFNTSVESASLSIRSDEVRFPRFMALHLPVNQVAEGDGKRTMSWKISNLPAVRDEPYGPPLGDLVPVIYLEPTAYSVSGYAGDFSTWKSIGDWIASLLQARDVLGPEILGKVNSLLSGAENTTEKVRRIYKYVQSTCRYVSVVVGLGGVQPEEAATVARLGYGDCKGLVNYTAALLKLAGIPSFYTLVRAGKNAEPIRQDFPGDQFNHIILCVPVEHDTLWLECTDQKIPLGFLGRFTCDRNALMVTPGGGILTRTPAYSGEQNFRSRLTFLKTDSSGNAAGHIRSIYGGIQFEDKMDLPYLSVAEQKESLRKDFNVAGAQYDAVSFRISRERLPRMEEQTDVIVPNYASVTGNRMFIPLHRFIDNPGTVPKDDNRTSEVIIPFPYLDSDTVVVEVPAGFKVETMPPPMDLATPFGSLKSVVKVEDHRITLCRRFELEKGRYPAVMYNPLAEFLRQVARQDKSGVVLARL